MTMCIILVVSAARLTSTDTQCLRNLLEEFLAGLLTTIFFLRVYTRSTIILHQTVLLVNLSKQFQKRIGIQELAVEKNQGYATCAAHILEFFGSG